MSEVQNLKIWIEELEKEIDRLTRQTVRDDRRLFRAYSLAIEHWPKAGRPIIAGFGEYLDVLDAVK